MNDRERMVISAFADGEVEAPWKAQVEEKIASDAGWAAEHQRHVGVKAALASSLEPDFAEAQARVRARLAGRPAAKVSSFPLPWLSVAAAALVVLAGAGGYLWGRASVPGVSAPGEVAELQVQVPKQLELKLSGEGQILMASTLEGTRR